MYDRKSDYALNKQDRDAIMCGSVTGVHIRLTRSDFSSEEEFQKWKAWSDRDYHTAEKAGRAYYDNRLPWRIGPSPAPPPPRNCFWRRMELTRPGRP